MEPETRNVLIDPNSLQARQHLLGNGQRRRLSSFLKALNLVGHARASFGRGLRWTEVAGWRRVLGVLSTRLPTAAAWLGRPLQASDLTAFDLLVLTTRFRACPYTRSELKAIEDFVCAGGSLWVMANHSRVPGTRMGDFTTEDSRLLSRFGIRTAEACFHTPGHLTELAIRGEAAYTLWPDRPGQISGPPVVINNCCGFHANSAQALVMLNEDMVDQGPNRLSPVGMAFAVLIDQNSSGGRVLATADSGFIGEPGVPASGPGLIDRGGNRQFIDRAIWWLLGSG